MTPLFYEKLFQLFIFLMPTQLAYHAWPQWAHIFGIRVDYLSPALYLTDILFVILFAGFLKNGGTRTLKKYRLPILVFLAAALLNTLFSNDMFPAIFKWLKVGELLALVLVIQNDQKVNVPKMIIAPLIASGVFFSFLGLGQFFLNRSVGWPLYLLGERHFDVTTLGIATTNFFGGEHLRAYSTFSHPNSFAGYLGVCLLLAGTIGVDKKIINRRMLYVFSAVIVLALASTLSLSAFTALAASLIFLGVYKKSRRAFRVLVMAIFGWAAVSSILLLFLDPATLFKFLPENINDRLDLITVSQEVFLKSPVFGVGLNNFFSAGNSFQPVHNIFLLVISETGILGLSLFLLLFYQTLKSSLAAEKKALAIVSVYIIITGVADHYWLTLQQNQFLLAAVFGIALRRQDKRKT